jgi:trimeric autotransporter adhesin
MKNLKLLVLLCTVIFVNAASAQWGLSGNGLTTSPKYFMGSSGAYDIDFRYNATNGSGGTGSAVGTQSGLLNATSGNTSWGVGGLMQYLGTGTGGTGGTLSGTQNTAIGYYSLSANTSGYNNISVGSYALTTNTSGYQNVAIGVSALTVNNGQANVAIGSYSLVANTSGPNNSAVGYQSLGANTTGQQSAALGYQALLGNTTGSNNVAVGYHTLTVNTTGSNNMALGYNANVSSAALTNATAIGANATAGQSNSIILGTTGTSVGIGTNTPGQLLDVAGNIKFSGALMPGNSAGTAGQVLTSGGAGAAATWTTPTIPSSGTSGYVLTSTGTGTTWAPAAMTFSGTTNYMAKFTPSGAAIGNSEIYDNGTFVGLNTTTAPSGYLFAVNGKAIFNKIVVEAYGNWADFVFQDNYKLPAITDVEKYIDQYQHLPGVPSASEVEKNGIDVGENQKILLQKVEELTLYIIDQNKQIENQNKEITSLQNQNEQLQELKKEVDDLKALLQKSK